MKKFDVVMPFAGSVTVRVEAESKDKAWDAALEALEDARFEANNPDAEVDEWEFYDVIAEGNVLHARQNRVEVTEVVDE